jgi:predicted kinase
VFCQVRALRRRGRGGEVAAPDAKLDLAERERLLGERPGSELERRLAKLPDGHPSSSGYGDAAVSSERGDDNGEPDRVEPLTDAEWAEHLAEVETKLDKARAQGLATDVQHTVDPRRVLWSAERESFHDSIVTDLYEKARDVPCDGKAFLAGGLPGAGKTTVISEHLGIDLSQYLRIDPDNVKEELGRRGLIPELDGLSPMEASDLVHEESSHIAKRLAQLAQSDRRNVIWDVTMSSPASSEKRIGLLRAAGYGQVEGVFVDIPLDVSARRASARHREGHDQYLAGSGLGGRYVPPETIRAQADDDWSSHNRRSFEQLKQRFDAWSLYDNSVDGHAPVLVDSSRSEDSQEDRR